MYNHCVCCKENMPTKKYIMFDVNIVLKFVFSLFSVVTVAYDPGTLS
jgi:hypothetical protein